MPITEKPNVPLNVVKAQVAPLTGYPNKANDNANYVSFGDSPSLDAFARFRVSNPTTLFDSKLLNPVSSTLYFDSQLTDGSGISITTQTKFKPYVDIEAQSGASGTFIRQSKRWFNYQPGKSQLILLTGVLDLSGGNSGTTRRLGYYEDNDGLFFQMSGSTVSVGIRSSDSGTPVDTLFNQADWNVDPLDGSGKSGIQLDFTKAQIFIIDFQWLSVGRVRWGFELSGQPFYCHEFTQVNSAAIPYMSNPNLPLRWELITEGDTGVSTRMICCAVISEGEVDPVGITQSSGTIAHVTAGTADTIYPVVGIRKKSTRFNSEIEPSVVSLLDEAAGNKNFEWLLVINPTISGTFTYNDLDDSVCQVAIGSTATATGGTVVSRGYGSNTVNQTISIDSLVKIGVFLDGTADELVLCVRPLDNGSNIQGSLTWKEIS